MDATRGWFKKFQKSKDALSSSKKKQKEMDTARDGQKLPLDEMPLDITKQKVAAAKQYAENHYKMQMKSLQERKERWFILERKLADADVFVEEQNNLIMNFEKKETEYMRIQRRKMGVVDFELLTIIGRGAFGEVKLCREEHRMYPCDEEAQEI